MTKVVFRKEKDGNILAVFNIIADCNYNLLSYAHLGQHGGCSYEYYIKETKPAKESEYQELLKELKQIGYNDLKIYKRLPISKIFR